MPELGTFRDVSGKFKIKFFGPIQPMSVDQLPDAIPLMPADNACQKYWDQSDWLIPVVILEQWCQGDQDCWKAKTLALMSACERGEVKYQRTDGKSFDDSVWELFRRQLLIVERASFDAWVIKIEGHNPLKSLPRQTDAPVFTASPAWRGRDNSVTPPRPVAPFAKHAGSDDQAAATAITSPSQAHVVEMVAAKVGAQEVVLPAVTSDALTLAFRMHQDTHRNQTWWKERLGNPDRYSDLEPARISKGIPNRGNQRKPSAWNLALVAVWLIDKKHMTRERVIKVIEKSFPDHDSVIDWI